MSAKQNEDRGLEWRFFKAMLPFLLVAFLITVVVAELGHLSPDHLALFMAPLLVGAAALGVVASPSILSELIARSSIEAIPIKDWPRWFVLIQYTLAFTCVVGGLLIVLGIHGEIRSLAFLIFGLCSMITFLQRSSKMFRRFAGLETSRSGLQASKPNLDV